MVQTGISSFMCFNDGQPVYRDDATNEVTVSQKHKGNRNARLLAVFPSLNIFKFVVATVKKKKSKFCIS